MKGRTNAGGSSVQIPLDAPTALTALAGNAKVSLTWTDPKDKYATPEGEQAQDPQQLVSKWAYTKIVRKVGSAPTGPYDGVLVVESSVRNQYQTTPFVDSGAENDVTYYYAAYAYNEAYIASAGTISNEVRPEDFVIYGAEWKGTDSTKWERLAAAKDFPEPVPSFNGAEGSSPFDSIMPWAGMVKSEDPEAGTVVAIPKYYYRWTKLSSGLRLEITTGSQKPEGFFVSPAHADRGDGKGERDVVYLGRYHCATDTYKSQTGGVALDKNVPQFRSYIHQLRADVWMWDWAIIWTIIMLYLVEYADWDDSIAFGLRPNSGGPNGSTDNMPYHTGSSAKSSAHSGHSQYRNIENLNDYLPDFLGGCYTNASGLFVVKNPESFASNGVGGGVLLAPYAAGHASDCEVTEVIESQWIYPTKAEGSASTYTAMYWGEYSGVLNHVTHSILGAFSFGTTKYSDSSIYITSRLMILPDPEVKSI